MMKKILIVTAIVAVALLSFYLLGKGQSFSGKDYPPKRYTDPVGEEFPIGAWYTFPKDEIASDEAFALVRESGINIGHQMVNDTAMMVSVLEKAQRYGLKMAFVSERIASLERLPSTVERLKKYPSFWGCYLKDEPAESNFEFISEQVKAIRKVDPDAGCFVNLLAAWIPERVGAQSFRQYVEDFIHECAPRFLSVDIYPVLKDGNGYRIISNYYRTYAELLEIGNTYGLPFCAVGLATALESHQWPAENNMRFEAFNALAYGAQGIIWWSYSPLPNHNDSFMGYPVDASGKRSSIWYAMKTVNTEIQNLRQVFRHCNVKGVWHTGRNLQKGCERLGSLPLPFDHLESNEEGVLVSYLENHGKEYLVIVNHDVDNPQNIRLTRSNKDRSARIFEVDPSGKEKRVNDLSFTLGPGGYRILRFR